MVDQELQIPYEFHTARGVVRSRELRRASEIAVIAHVFYEDLFEETRDYLRTLPNSDVYVSVPESNRGFQETILAAFPDARIYVTENRGRDILPFIAIYRGIRPLDYPYLLKIHTKKSLHTRDGVNWGADMYRKLMGSPEVINSVMSAFESHRRTGIIGPRGHVVDGHTNWRPNQKKTTELARRAGIFKDSFLFNFVAGSMFWARPAALQYLATLPLQDREFEAEPLGVDGAMVHAVERFIGLSCEALGYKIGEVDEHGKFYEPLPAPGRHLSTTGEAWNGHVHPQNLASRGREIVARAYRIWRVQGLRTLLKTVAAWLR